MRRSAPPRPPRLSRLTQVAAHCACDSTIDLHPTWDAALEGAAGPGPAGDAPIMYRAPHTERVLAGQTRRGGLVHAQFVKLHRSLWVGALVPAFFVLSSCSEDTAVSPETSEVRASALKAGQGNIGLKVHTQARLLPNGDVEVLVSARCPVGYVRQESGPLTVTQRLASAEAFVQVQRGGCTGRWDTVKAVARRNDPSDPAFSRGRARVSMTFAAENPNDPTGEDVLQVSVVKQLHIR